MPGSNLPAHVGIIMDGNGRWAKSRGLPRILGHREGVKTVKRIVTHAVKRGVKYLSLFAFSTENWLRPGEEVSGLMGLLDDYLASELSTMMRENVRLMVSGRIDLIPSGVRKHLLKTVEDTKNNTGMVLNLALSYGGRAELTDAVQMIARAVREGTLTPEAVTEEVIAGHLYNPEIPDLDLVIRTSGEQRISNFMLWRAAYAEFFFSTLLWPDFSDKEFDTALDDFSARKRRFGKTDEQIS